jgi:hypothetical protein
MLFLHMNAYYVYGPKSARAVVELELAIRRGPSTHPRVGLRRSLQSRIDFDKPSGRRDHVGLYLKEGAEVAVPPQLVEVSERVKQGQSPSVSVREFISWFWGSKRRGSFVVMAIRDALAEVKITTSPDFNET